MSVGPGICILPLTPYPHIKMLLPSVVLMYPALAVKLNVDPLRPWIVASAGTVPRRSRANTVPLANRVQFLIALFIGFSFSLHLSLNLTAQES
jgi:hypothetical protein